MGFFSGNLFIPKSDKYVISHNSITPESNTKVMRIKEMIMNSKSSQLLTLSLPRSN